MEKTMTEQLEDLREAVDGFIQKAGTLIDELRVAIESTDAVAQKDILEVLASELDKLKPELN
jgi:hypothetical protein